MKKALVLIFFLVLAISLYAYFSRDIYQRNLAVLSKDEEKIEEYRDLGFKTDSFRTMYSSLLDEYRKLPFVLSPFTVSRYSKRHDNIFYLLKSGYETELAKKKDEVQSRLSYLRNRVRSTDYISAENKAHYFDSFDATAGAVFEKNSSLNDIAGSLEWLSLSDEAITKDIEASRKESIRLELSQYKSTCENLLSYFEEKNSPQNGTTAQECIQSADTLMSDKYAKNGADFIESLSRERVYEAMQKALNAKQQMLQDEQYAALIKKQEEEKYTLVPPSPRPMGKVIVINLSLQRLYAYENGATLFPQAIPVTTGKQGFETVTGDFAIYLKEQQHQMKSPFPGIYYDDIVNYWMPFYLGYGLHDAPWRSVYGTSDYGSVGSHGCVNIPLKETSILYNWAEVGTRVIVL